MPASRHLWVLALLWVLSACGGSGGGGSTPSHPLDLDGDGLLRFPWGADDDDDGDGFVTFLMGGTDYNDADATLQRNGGNGQFASPVSYPTGEVPRGAALGDVNGDGNLDVVVTNEDSRDITVFLGTGDGTLGTPVAYATLEGGVDILLADFNRDNHLDVLSGGGRISLGNGVGGFLDSGSADWSGGRTPFARDLNGDGILDLIGASDFFGVSVVLGIGDGTFGTSIGYPAFGATTIAVSDFDSNGTWDAIVAQSTMDTLGLLAGDGAGALGSEVTINAPGTATFVASGDVNNDGHPDFVVTGGASDQVFVFRGTGAGNFALPSSFSVGTTAGPPTLCDFNGDGNLDLAIPAELGDLLLLDGAGDGTFTARPAINAGLRETDVACGDLNNDGKIDLVVTNVGGDTLSVLLGL